MATSPPLNDEAERDRARRALEQVCARGDFAAAEGLYSPRFVDHVNDLDYHGHKGIRESVGLYMRVFSDLRVDVVDQVSEGDRGVSRWVAEGTNRGRRVQLKGITISRFENGMIAEDWSISDSLSLLRQLGPRRAILLGARELVHLLRRR